jgi:hypothetical protein
MVGGLDALRATKVEWRRVGGRGYFIRNRAPRRCPRRTTMPISRARWPLAAGLTLAASLAFAHGDVAPQPVNTDALPDVGEEWLTENPYRSMDPEVFQTAIQI